MSVRKKNGRWEYRFQMNGEPVRGSTGLEATARNKKAAEQLEAVHRYAIVEGRLGIRRLKVRSFKAAVTEFLAYKKVNVEAQNTYLRIKTSMVSARLFFGDRILSTITSGDVERYKTWRLSGDHTVRAVKPVTVKHDLDNVSLLFQWAVKEEYARLNVVVEVERPSDKDSRREYILSHADERLYFANARGNLYGVARLILLQGLRPEEATGLGKADVNLERGYLTVRYGKTEAARRTLQLTDEAKAILAPRLATVGPWVFPSSKRDGEHITKLNCPHDRLCLKLGLAFVLYDLRHTFATRMIAAGVDIVTLSKIMGHTTVRVTERYIHLQQEAQDRGMTIYNDLVNARAAAEIVH